MASTVFSSFGPQRPPEHNMDERLDAARALLGVSPNSVVEGNESVTLFGGRAFEATGQGGIIGRLNAEVHGMACAGGTYDVLMDGVARSMLLSMHSSL